MVLPYVSLSRVALGRLSSTPSVRNSASEVGTLLHRIAALTAARQAEAEQAAAQREAVEIERGAIAAAVEAHKHAAAQRLRQWQAQSFGRALGRAGVPRPESADEKRMRALQRWRAHARHSRCARHRSR